MGLMGRMGGIRGRWREGADESTLNVKRSRGGGWGNDGGVHDRDSSTSLRRGYGRQAGSG
jgi:hypothetical protein